MLDWCHLQPVLYLFLSLWNSVTLLLSVQMKNMTTDPKEIKEEVPEEEAPKDAVSKKED